MGCMFALIGSILIVLHGPKVREVASLEELLFRLQDVCTAVCLSNQWIHNLHETYKKHYSVVNHQIGKFLLVVKSTLRITYFQNFTGHWLVSQSYMDLKVHICRKVALIPMRGAIERTYCRILFTKNLIRWSRSIAPLSGHNATLLQMWTFKSI